MNSVDRYRKGRRLEARRRSAETRRIRRYREAMRDTFESSGEEDNVSGASEGSKMRRQNLRERLAKIRRSSRQSSDSSNTEEEAGAPSSRRQRRVDSAAVGRRSARFTRRRRRHSNDSSSSERSSSDLACTTTNSSSSRCASTSSSDVDVDTDSDSPTTRVNGLSKERLGDRGRAVQMSTAQLGLHLFRVASGFEEESAQSLPEILTVTAMPLEANEVIAPTELRGLPVNTLQDLRHMQNPDVWTGWMNKLSSKFFFSKEWRRRYFILNFRTQLLFLCKDGNESEAAAYKIFHMEKHDYVLDKSQDGMYGRENILMLLQIRPSGMYKASLTLSCDTKMDKNDWVRAFARVLKRQQLPPDPGSGDSKTLVVTLESDLM